MIDLATTVDEYLRVRRALGFKLERETRLLPAFVAFLHRHRGASITTDLALRWAMEPTDASTTWWAKRLGMVRGFARYLQARDPRTEVPPRELLPAPGSARLEPYVYADDDVRALLKATAILGPFRGATYAALLGLLAVTGMRVGEAIALDRSDIEWRERQLVIRSGKFGKARELPLHSTTMAALAAYASGRERAVPRPSSPAFLLSARRGRRLLYQNVHFYFRRLRGAAGLAGHRPHPPRLHDLRHTFAIKTLLDWYRAGVDVAPRIASLSTYLGHVCPSHTYWYLTATPELLQLAGQRLARRRGEPS